jgi:glycosyltransferase involved in cell wall biosynthesis
MYPPSIKDQYYLRLRAAGIQVDSIGSASTRTGMTLGRRLAANVLRALPASRRILQKQSLHISTHISQRYFHPAREYFHRSRADVVHVLTPDPNAMVLIRAAHAAGLPVIYQELGTPYHPPAFEFYYQQFTSALPFCSQVAALSPRLLQECREKLPNARGFSLIPLSIEAPLNGHPSPPRSAHDVTFGFAGRIERLKGAHILIDSFVAARRQARDIRLKIAGRGSQKEEVAAAAKAAQVESECEFVGVYDNPEQKGRFMRSLDVFVLPSLTEGTPNTIVEAMAYGLPIIASDVGGIPDMVTPETGIVVPAQSPKALADAMIRLAFDPDLRAEMGRAAIRRYEKIFSPKVVLPLMLETYRRVAAMGNGTRAPNAPGSKNGYTHPWVAKLQL